MAVWVVLGLATAVGAGNRYAEIGKVTRVVPRTDVTRGGFSGVLQENATVAENDKIQTQDGGRARVVLTDGSILSIGSSSSLVIKPSTGVTRAGSLEIAYGMVRAQVSSQVGKPNFQLRTSTAVCGVLGTEVFVDVTPTSSHVINLSDPKSGSKVRVASSDSRITGEVILEPGQGTIVEKGKPPIPPHEMGRAMTDPLVSQTDVP